MRLRITTPLTSVVDVDGVESLRAEDASGDFGIQPHHADFITSLSVGIVRWTAGGEARHFCAVRGGVLTVMAGQEVAIATREAIAGDDLATLDRVILDRFRDDIEAERKDRADSTRLELNAIRQIVRHLRPPGYDGIGGGP